MLVALDREHGLDDISPAVAQREVFGWFSTKIILVDQPAAGLVAKIGG